MPVRLVVALGTVALLLGLTMGQAEAKLPSYVLTGGDLGQHAMYFALPDYAYVDGGLLSGATPSADGPAYDIYDGDALRNYVRWVRSPVYRYYPAEQSLGNLETDVSWRVTSQRAAELDAVIDRALSRLSYDDLEAGVLAAVLDESSIAGSRMRLVAKPNAFQPNIAVACPCDIPQGSMDHWIMSDLVHSLSSRSGLPLPGDGSDLEIRIEFPGESGYGSFAHYAFPQGGRAGRLWIWPNSDHPIGQPYAETTAGFDAVIADAVDSQVAKSTGSSRESEDVTPALTGILAALAGGIALLSSRYALSRAART
jgi:hypothetical protein